jgi:phosphoribosylformylglycinamidine (FGAM) synthase-like amidotransferase family enzyme
MQSRNLAELRAEDRIVFSYVQNPNGSMADIAGVCNDGRNVVGLMPHPERASHSLLGSTDGLVILSSLLQGATTPSVDGDHRTRSMPSGGDQRSLPHISRRNV